MIQHRIAVIPGDGIGKDVIPEGLKAVQEAALLAGFDLATEFFPWGSEYYLQTGQMMPPDALDTLAGFDAIYLGAVGSPQVPDHVTLWGLLLPVRKGFDLYVNYRPIQLLEGVRTPIRDKGPADIDFVCIRENTEGEYSGVGGRVHVGTEQEVAMQTTVFTRHGVERVVRYALDLARSRRKRLASITKSNAQQYSSVFWDEVVRELAEEYPDVQVRHIHVDAATIYFVTEPESFDVVVGSNLFADILTDLGGAIQGGLGLAPSANFHPGRKPALFEPTHGSAPTIAGKGLANPIATIWSGSLMLDWLGEIKGGALIYEGIKRVLREGQVRTPDLGGTSTTSEVGDAIVDAMRSLAGQR